jgi:hypothetical protein
VLEPPADNRIALPGLRVNAREARLLSDPARRLPLRRDADAVRIDVSGVAFDAADTVIRLDLESAPVVDPPVIEAEPNGVFRLDYIRANTAGRAVKRFNRKGGFHISRWRGPADAVTWHLRLPRAADYEVLVRHAAAPGSAGREFVVEAGGRALSGRVAATEGWYAYETHGIGRLALPAGTHALRVRPKVAGDTDLMFMAEAELRPSG